MGLFGDILAATETGSGAVASENTLVTLVRTGLNEGMSGNAILQGMQSVGLGLRRQSFYQLVGEVRSSLGAGAWATGVDPNTIPTSENIVSWTGGTAGKYLTRVNVYVRERIGEGEYEVARRGLSFLSNEPISPAQAIQNAQDMPTGMDNYPSRQTLGYEYNGTYLQE